MFGPIQRGVMLLDNVYFNSSLLLVHVAKHVLDVGFFYFFNHKQF